jgi:hypothetical protein
VLFGLIGVAVILGAIVLFAGNGGDNNSSGGGASPVTTQAGATGASGATTGTGGVLAGEAKSAVERSPLLVAGKVQKFTVKKGTIVEIRAKSDTPEELHVHGYDRKAELTPGKTGTVRLKAKIDGIFEIELEHAGEQVGELRVEP